MSDDESSLLIYDGDCGFCTYWAQRWRQRSDGKMSIAPLQEDPSRPDEIAIADLESAVHLVEGDAIYRGAEAVFKVLAYGRGLGWMLWVYRHVPGWGRLMDWGYQWVADHRPLVSRWTRWMRRS